MTDIDLLKRIRRLVIIALFSDDDLMDILVLKGGNAIDIVYELAGRASIDLDFSMATEFEKEEIHRIEAKIEKALRSTFEDEGFEVFDVSFRERPKVISPEAKGFWGGYRIEGKIIEKDKFTRLEQNIDGLRRQAVAVGPGDRRKLKIDISKFEYCDGKQDMELDGYTIYVYSPAMMVIEKLRAICQQMPEYADVIPNPSRSARARDFFDIYLLVEKFHIDLSTAENIELLEAIFSAKKAPLSFIRNIKEYRDYHQQDFDAVRNTVSHQVDLQPFDFYFDYTVGICDRLETLGVI